MTTKSTQSSHDDRLTEPARPDELAAVVALVRSAGLPAGGLADQFPAGYAVVRSGRELVAVAGLEVHGRAGLLRSVAVAPAQRATGLGRRLVEDRLRAARDLGLGALYLLTTTAADYFRSLGFHDVARHDVPAELQASPEFASVCPFTAVCLARSIS